MILSLNFLLCILALFGLSFADNPSITGRNVRVTWSETADGWLAQLQTKDDDKTWKSASAPQGQYGLLANYSTAPQDSSRVKKGQAGDYTEFLPANVTQPDETSGIVTTTNTVENGTFTARWWIDTSRSWDLVAVNVTWKPAVSGWYSIPSPRLAAVPDDQLGWGIVPGYWSSSELNSDEETLYKLVQGVPDYPYVSMEASTTSLVAILSNNGTNYNFAVVPDPSLARDPNPSTDTSAQAQWNVGLGLRSRNGTLSPTAYYPVLGQAQSKMTGGESSVSATFLYFVSGDPDVTWYEVNKLVHSEIYPISEYDKRAKNIVSLRERLNRIHDFIVTPASKWHLWSYQNLTLGAESGKLSDVGAMWSMQRLTGDPFLAEQRLPYARNFKLAQQDTSGGVFNGAALGEYFKNGGFVSELIWLGNSNEDYVSPIFTTFYTLSDMGNILLFNPDDELLLSRFKLAAEKLLSWQKPEGEFDIGYLKSNTSKNKYPHLTDNRATWYGLLAAHRVLDGTKYLDGAEAGARWFIENVLETGRWLGVCDDSYLYPDFATVFAAQALLDLYKETDDELYRDAAITAAKFYTLHVFNHPVVDDNTHTRSGVTYHDWQLSQTGLTYEHAGYTGTANVRGPIYLSSHAGAFIRFYELTGDGFFLDLARTAARGRDAFVDPTSSIPSYYWYQGNTGGSAYPWHGWWHIGWVMDYLLASAHMLSDGEIDFPYGFITAKVGSHVPYGFASGTVFGEDAELWQPRHLLNVSDPEIDYITARSTDGSKLFILLINEASSKKKVTLSLNPRTLVPGKVATWGDTSTKAGSVSKTGDNAWSATVAGNGLTVAVIETSLKNDPRGPEFRSFNITGTPTAPVVSWSFWTIVESRVQWAIPRSGVWTSLPSSTNYTFSQTINLANVDNTTEVKIRIASTKDSYSGISDAVLWEV
ncbi:hypothetical protein ASPCAL14216 [Aspergillus calidoustus]|uniref:Uncharacterized protein n=1 Tax=Aspergillus calidoustus TaxID=454130 RepID=A0A0U5GH11_ASPCI|nr:hypothetical protein ASPCAL14216 [Aspergillus calidoustus]